MSRPLYDALLRGADGSRDGHRRTRNGKEVGHLRRDHSPAREGPEVDPRSRRPDGGGDERGRTSAAQPWIRIRARSLPCVPQPTFDPNLEFTSWQLSKSYWNEILTNPNHLLNKAIRLLSSAPGSTFKIIMSYAGLARGARSTHARPLQPRRNLLRPSLADRNHGMVNTHDNAIPTVRYLLLLADRSSGSTPLPDTLRPWHRAEDRHRPSG